jgi:hypothetical protein
LIKLDKNEKGFMSKKFNMWRLYGKDGKGCLINFEFSITPPLDWHEFYFAPIKYGIEKKINISRLKRYLDNINRSSEKIGIDLDPLPCFHKSGLYRMEKEFRLLYDGREIKGYKPRNITQNGIKIFPNIFVEPRNRSTKLIKYLDLPIFKSAFQNIDESIPILKINSITLGYQFKNNFDRKRSELESLANQNLGYVPEITRSLLSKTYWGK